MQFLDLKSQYKSIKKEIDAALKKVLENCVFIGGLEISELEKTISEFCGAKFAVGVNSGTDALLLSLRALNIGPGDEVITSPYTFIATAEVIASCGAKPVFADIEPETFNIDPLEIEKKITRKTKALIAVHLFGQTADMKEIRKIAKKNKLYVIEDAAQAIGAGYRDKKAGSFGDLGCFSFFPSKNLGAYGDGGMIITNNQVLAERIRLLRNHGSLAKEKYLNLILGTNSRLDVIQAAILMIKLQHLQDWTKKRQMLAGCYDKNLKKAGDIKIPFVGGGRTHIFHQYTVRTKKRDELKNYLEKNNVPTMIYYPLPLHLQPCFKYLGYKKSDFPEAEKAAKEVLSLPIYPELKKKEQDFIIQKIKEFYAKDN